MSDIIPQLRDALGHEAVVSGDALEGRATSYWDSSPMQALALVQPRSTAQVSTLMRLCHAARQSVVVQGGLTGTVAGAVPNSKSIALSLSRMSAIESIDPIGATCIVQAGAVLQKVQEELNQHDLLLPLDLGARGSCTIGGNVATNAGGINVLRYGMMRNLVLGLEVVLADGTVVSSMSSMLKNNAGFDLKQLFIGTEGVLGVVTRVVLRLFPRPASRQTAMVACADFGQVAAFLNLLQRELGGSLCAFEVMWNNYYRSQIEAADRRAPLDAEHAYYVIVESEGAQPESDAAQFGRALESAVDQELIVDAVIAKSDSERLSLWAIRENLEPVLRDDVVYLYDVSVPIKDMPEYVAGVSGTLQARWPKSRCFTMGHIADGNLHFFVHPRQASTTQAECDEIVYSPLKAYGGSVSAEHGIGYDKKLWLSRSRSLEEIQLMQGLKRMLDPHGILNPGCVIDP